MKYSVISVDEAFGKSVVANEMDDKTATDLARMVVKQVSELHIYHIYVTWFRKSDGQEGYLNPNGDHAFLGKTWNTIHSE